MYAQTLDAIAAVYAEFLSGVDLHALGRSLEALDAADYLHGGLWRVASVVSASRDCRHHVKKAWAVSVMLLIHRSLQDGNAGAWKQLVPVDANGRSAEWENFMETLLALGSECFSAGDDQQDERWTLLEKTLLAQFLSHCFASLDEPFVASSVMKLCSLAMWRALSPSQRQIEFQAHPKLERHWKKLLSAQEAHSEQEEVAKPANKRRKVSTPSKKHKKQTEALPDAAWMFLVHLCDDFLSTINSQPVDIKQVEADDQLRYVGVFLELATDLLSQLPTRRFLHVVLRRRRFLRRTRSSVWMQHFLHPDQGKRSADEVSALEKQLVLLEAYMAFPIDAHAGSASWDAREHRERRSARIQSLQQLVFRDFRDTSVEQLAIVPVSHIADRDSFTELLTRAVTSADDGHDKLQALAVAIGLAADIAEARSLSESGELIDAFLDEFSVSSHNAIDSDAVLNELSVFPTEADIWSSILGSSSGLSEVSGDVYGASDAHLFPLLPIRKLGLQFLDLADYLQRNYELCRLEAAHDIRVDLEAAIKHMDAVRALQNTGNGADATIFRGFSPMAVPLSSAGQIVKVSKPALGKSSPSLVLARVELELSSRHRADAFDSYQTCEVVYLVTVRATRDEAAELMGFQEKATPREDGGFFPEEFGIVHVRAGELIEVTDGSGKVIHSEESSATAEGNDGANTTPRGRTRVFKVALDGNQYKKDLDSGNLEAYEHANLLIRRKPRENNFKAVLDTIVRAWQQSHHVNKRLAQRQADGGDEDDHESAPAMVPTWLHDLVLGYGDPSTAQYSAILKARNHLQRAEVPLFEAIADGNHAKEIADAIDCKLVDASDNQSELSPDHAQGPFVYSERVLEDSDSDMGEPKVFIKAHRRPDNTDASASTESTVRFTPAQVEAIRAGSNEGLTLVVGPPGTGKTDVAVQLVLNLYRSVPAGEKILLVANSNQALNDFFGKILARQTIHESQIVRLGQAANAEDSKTTPAFELKGDFSASGRVTFLLQRRLELLNEVKYMAAWVEQRSTSNGDSQGSTAGLGESASYSCENALYFYRMHMKSLVEQALAVDALTTEVVLVDYYAKRNGADPAAGPSLETLKQFAAIINSYFLELERLQPFELLHTTRQRADMYLVHHARILVMTCTHAAVHHRRLADLGITIGSVVMEEAAQVSEIDSLIPILLACARSSKAAALSGVSASSSLFSGSLKRLVLMGDPQQLPPVVKAHALKTYAHFDQSLFTRLLRLGVPRVVLNQQGRSRTELADVYRWRYQTGSDDAALGDLPCVSALSQFQLANPGFAFVGQLIDVDEGRERQPQPSAFENVKEAHFAVAVVKYMVAVGYAPSRITVLTTYNAQRELLHRLLQQDTSSGKGKAICKVSTVDHFQGQQNDFIVLSTVRSGDVVGHLRDVRRASSAFSCARLGLYVLGRRATLDRSKELAPFIEKLEALAPSETSGGLVLVPSERVGDGFSRSAVAASGKKTKKGALKTVTVSSAKELDDLVAEVTKSGKKAAK